MEQAGSQRVNDVEKAKVMAEAGNKLETKAAIGNQQTQILDEALKELTETDDKTRFFGLKFMSDFETKYGIKLAKIENPNDTEEQIIKKYGDSGLRNLGQRFMSRLWESSTEGAIQKNSEEIKAQIDTALSDANQREEVAGILHENPGYKFSNNEVATTESVMEYRNEYNYFGHCRTKFFELLRASDDNSKLEFDDIFDDRALILDPENGREIKREVKDIAKEFLIYSEFQERYQDMFANGPFTPESRKKFARDFIWDFTRILQIAQFDIQKKVGPKALDLLGVKSDKFEHSSAA
jgi:hypothetical protein